MSKTNLGSPIRLFTRHPTAANLLMMIMIIAGLFSLREMNTQFFPDFGIYDSFTNCDFRIKVNFCKAGKDTKQRISRKRTFKRERICKSRNSKPRKYY